MTKISFVCPIYNKKKYLNNVLNSIKSQLGSFDKEYIFINDGSNDGSLEFIKEKTKKWKNTLILSQTNKGPASATQKGILNSTGDYIKLVGGDDIMAPNCTKMLVDTIMKTKSIAVFSNYKLYNKTSDIHFVGNKVKNIKIIKKPLLSTIKSSFSGTTPNLYSNEFIKKAGGCDTRLFVEDFSLVLRLSKFGKFSFIENITSFGPKEDENRIMIGKKNQLIHDFNAAIYYYIKDNPDLSKTIKQIACIKCLGRSEKWYRRELKKTFFTKINFLRLRYYLFQNKEEQLIKDSCKIFYDDTSKKMHEIRYKVL